MEQVEERVQVAFASLMQRMKTRWGRAITSIAVVIFIIYVYTPSSSQGPSSARPPNHLANTAPSSPSTKHWPGWHSIKHVIAFGDSYTTTGFRVNGEQPRPENPFGNPEYPGLTTSNGPNWIDFLTTTYNDTFVKTINFAFGGATVDQAIIPQFLPAIKSFKDQLFDFYLPHYSAAPASFPWKATDTLFTFFFGINDVHTAILKPTPGASTAQILKTAVARYAAFIDVLYQSGARNFLFFNVPPVERAPTVTIKGAAEVQAHAEAIVQWNRDVSALVNNLTTTYPDVTTLLFDANSLYNQVMDNPCSYVETCALEDTSASCEQYIRNQPATWYSKDPACRYAVDHYFWLNMLHPTFRIHNITAKSIAQQLKSKII